MVLVLVWIAVALIFAVAEVTTTALFAAFLAAGAVAAAAVAYADQGVVAQAVAFAAVSLLGIVVARPWLRHRFARRPSAETVSGATAMIGEIATVVDVVAGVKRPSLKRRGHVLILGEHWPAITDDGSTLSRGTVVEIVAIEGATLVVERTARIGEGAAPPAFT
jgi:membrane protein implicated in regulation of membrane protease activity